MITFDQASRYFKKQYPRKKIMNAADLDSTRYVVVAQEDPAKKDFADPIFFISKKDGTVNQMTSVNVKEINRINEAFSLRKIKA